MSAVGVVIKTIKPGPGYRVIEPMNGNYSSGIHPKFTGVYMRRVIEVRSAEGGEDASLFATDLLKAYSKAFDRDN